MSARVPAAEYWPGLYAAAELEPAAAEVGAGAAVSGGGWRDRAACRGVDPELFFPVSCLGVAVEAQVARAKAVCAGCPVRRPCLVFAVEAIPEGVAGGLSAEERRELRAGGVAEWRAEERRQERVPVAEGAGGTSVRVGRLMAGEPVEGVSPAELVAAVVGLGRRGPGAGWIAARLGLGERRVQRWLAHHRAVAVSSGAPCAERAGGVGGERS